jgi:WS/DGAT/MGAT family acyltransferase
MLCFFEGEIPFERLLRHIEQRLDAIPQFRRRLASVPFNLAHASLEDAPDFKIENHVKRHELASGTSEAAMVEAALTIYEPPLDRNHPLWEIHAFSGLEGRTCLLLKIHQCLIEGVSPIGITSALFDLRADVAPPESPARPWNPHPMPGLAETLLTAVHDLLEERVDSAFRAQELLRNPTELSERTTMLGDAARTLTRLVSQPVAPAPWNAALVSQRRALAWSRYPFADFRAIRNAFGGSVNDVVLTIASEAAARYLAQRGVKPGVLPLRIGCPVNVPYEDESGKLANRISMIFLELPATPMDPVARLEMAQQESERAKSAREAQSLELLSEAINLIPPGLLGVTSRLTNAGLEFAGTIGQLASMLPSCGVLGIPSLGLNFMATNTPGVQVAQYLAGHLLQDMIGLTPLMPCIGYGVSIVGYNQNLYFGMIAEPRLMPDLETMKSCLDEVFEELTRSARNKGPQAEAPLDS